MRTLFICTALLFGCGEPVEKTKIVEIEVPIPVPCGPGGGEAGTSFAEMRTLFNKNCVQCHASDKFAQSEIEMRDPDNNVEARIFNRSMPPNANAMSDADRAAMIDFF